MKKLSPRALLILAALLGLVCTFMIYSYLKRATPKPKEMATVAVAAKDLNTGTKLAPDMLKVEKIPKELVQPDALKSVEEAVGKELWMPVNEGDQITKKRLADSNRGRSGLIASIPKDKRAMTVSVTEITGVGGFIRPSSHVDVVSTLPGNDERPATTKLLLQNVLVLAVGNSTFNNVEAKEGEKKNDDKKKETSKNVTLAVTPNDAVVLQLAQQEGKISLILRPDKPSEYYVIGASATGAPPPQKHKPASSQKQAAPPPPPDNPNNTSVTVIRGTKVGR